MANGKTGKTGRTAGKTAGKKAGRKAGRKAGGKAGRKAGRTEERQEKDVPGIQYLAAIPQGKGVAVLPLLHVEGKAKLIQAIFHRYNEVRLRRHVLLESTDVPVQNIQSVRFVQYTIFIQKGYSSTKYPVSNDLPVHNLHSERIFQCTNIQSVTTFQYKIFSQ